MPSDLAGSVPVAAFPAVHSDSAAEDADSVAVTAVAYIAAVVLAAVTA